MPEAIFHYDRPLRRTDILELYVKRIANLGPLNIFFEKHVSVRGDGSGKRDDQRYATGGYCMVGTHKGLHAYLAVQLMNCEPPRSCEMERRSIGSRRSITLENTSGGLQAKVLDSVHGIRKVKKTLDQIFGEPSPQEKAQAQAIVDFLKAE